MFKGLKNSCFVVYLLKQYPSSKKCSCCGAIKRDLRLSDRVFVCNDCSLIIDRDINASINLSKYQLAS